MLARSCAWRTQIVAIALLGTASVAATTAARAQGGGTSRASALWLGEFMAMPAISPAPSGTGKSKAAALKVKAGSVDAETRERLAWWSTGGAAYRWNEIILDEMQNAFVVLPTAARHLALFHAAIDDAVVIARKYNAPLTSTVSIGNSQVNIASEHVAVATAASAILAHLFPNRAAHFAQKAEEARTVRSLAGADTAGAIRIGEDIGNKVAEAAIERARSDGSNARWTGSVPEGASHWKGTNPIAPTAANWRPWVLTSPSELRPAPPPAVGSDDVRSALAELKSFPRTPKSNHHAVYWEVHGGARAHTLWNEIARMKLLEAGKGIEDGARVLSAVNIALADAGVACWDAKYTYWYIRPPQLDPELKPLFTPPNHPSFPAAHGCFSTAAATVLAHVFTRDRERILALGKEAAEARIWAGIHFRFDIDAGQEIGRRVGEKVIARAFGSRGS